MESKEKIFSQLVPLSTSAVFSKWIGDDESKVIQHIKNLILWDCIKHVYWNTEVYLNKIYVTDQV